MKRNCGWLSILFVILAVSAKMNGTKLPDSAEILPELQTEPVQTRIAKDPFSVQVDEFTYLVKPLYEYALYGLVVSKHHSDSIFDYHHKRWNDYLNMADLCVVWGSNTNANLHKKLAFENTTWTCWVRWNDRLTAANFRGTQLSNNHLLSEDDYIVDKIKSAEVGDQIYLSGYLAEYYQGTFSRGTSTVRDDTGNGACETIYVEQFDILQTANRGWRLLAFLSWFFAAGCFLYFMFGGSPLKYK